MASSSNAKGRRRPRKGNRRMDAAIDAMKPLGFGEDLVTLTVTELLKVYGGQGWMFIEEHSYSVLLEALLEKRSNSEQENKNSECDEAGLSAAGKSNSICSTPISNMEAAHVVSEKMHVSLHEKIKSNDTEMSIAGDWSPISSPPSSNMEAVGADLGPRHASLKDNSEGNDRQKSIASKLSSIGATPTSKMETVGAALQTNQAVVPLVQKNKSLDSAPHNDEPDAKDVNLSIGQEKLARKRKPYYGWIDRDDEDEEFVELMPAPLPHHIAKLLAGNSVKRVRFSLG